MRRASFLVLTLVFALPGAGAADGGDKAPKLSEEEKKILELTNEARAKEKLPPLAVNAALTLAARDHSANMAKQRRMAHELDGKTPADRARAAGYPFARLGENVAFGAGPGGETDVIFKAWMDSKTHRDNVVSKEYQEIGIGRVTNEHGEIYFTQVFGRARKR